MTELSKLPIALDNESNADYHARREFISASRLKVMAQSPLHYHEYFNDPNKKATSSQELGTLVHTMLLEHDKFENEYYIPKEAKKDGRTKDGKDQALIWLAESGGKIIIPKEDFAVAQAMYDSALKNEAIIKLLSSGTPEQSLYWIDEPTGLKAKARCDWRMKNKLGQTVIADVKTTTDASPDSFGKTIINYDYITQAGMQAEAVSSVLGETVWYYIYIAIENVFPYATCCYRLNEEDLELGRAQYRLFMNRVKECTDSGIWGGYDRESKNGIVEAVLPSWRKNLI